MNLFTLEQSKSAYLADFALYGIGLLVLAVFLLIAGPRQRWMQSIVLIFFGLASWTLIEYGLHRFVLHGVRPFSTWHADHHQRPTALICTPTLLSASLIALFVYLPVLFLSDLWRACAFTFGVLIGYFVYGIMHHAIHHWRIDIAWFKSRKRWHALHHSSIGKQGYYGVTSGLWDRVFGSANKVNKVNTRI